MTNETVKCPTCHGRAERRAYGFIYCLEPNCIENPASEAARIDRRATLDAVGEDGPETDDATEDEE